MGNTDIIIGKTLAGRYKVQSKIGDGGMGVVYQAMQTSVDRIVAVKILHPELMSNQDVLERFHREAKTCSKLRGNNTIHLYDFGIEDGLTYLVMEYVDGKTLDDLLSESGLLHPHRITRLTGDVCSALSEAHDLGIVHRDLKPANIMITQRENRQEEVKVVDFGIAKIISADKHAAKLTQTGMIIGTPQYMSPEQAEGKSIDHRSDIYSLGIILYELFTGETPFQAETTLQLLLKHVNTPPLPPAQCRPGLDIPPEIEMLILKALAKKPENRYQDVETLYRDLKQATDKLTGEATADGTKLTSKTGASAHQIIPEDAAAKQKMAAGRSSSEEVELGATELATKINGTSDIGKTEVAKTTKIKAKKKGIWLWGIAAVLILGLTFGGINFLTPAMGELTFSVVPDNAQVSVYSPDVPEEDIQRLTLQEKHHIENLNKVINVNWEDASKLYHYRLPAGEYTIKASLAGYNSIQREVAVYKDQTTSLETFFLTKIKTGIKKILGAKSDNLSLFRIRVRPPNARITVESFTLKPRTYMPASQENGVFDFNVPGDESYVVTASLEGYTTKRKIMSVSSVLLLNWLNLNLTAKSDSSNRLQELLIK